VDESVIDGTPHYKVKWTGYGDDECTWEPLEHIEHLDAYKEWLDGKVEKAMMVAVMSKEPMSYAEALQSPDAEQWVEGMASELASLAKNNTWEVVERLPPGHKALGSKWVFKIKKNADGSIARFKAYLVVKDYQQWEGIDYDETFAPVAKFSTIRLLLAIAAMDDMEIWQMDVVTAFLNGELSEIKFIFMKAPEGSGLPPGTIVRLLRMLYGLKQSPRKWNERLNTYLLSVGFQRSLNDPALYWRNGDDGTSYILVYMDDLLILTPKGSTFLSEIKEALSKEFEMKDLGEAKSFLGMEITRDCSKRTITLSQKGYTENVLERFGYTKASPCRTPMVSHRLEKLTKTGDPEEYNPREEVYRSIIGSLMYLMIATRPDLANSVGIVSRYLANLSKEHLMAAKHILPYVKGTKDYA